MTHTVAPTLSHSPFLRLCFILTLQFRPLAGLRGEADASELVLVRLPPAHLQQAVHVPQGHLRSSAGSGSAFSTPLSHSGGEWPVVLTAAIVNILGIFTWLFIVFILLSLAMVNWIWKTHVVVMTNRGHYVEMLLASIPTVRSICSWLISVFSLVLSFW